MTSKPLHAIRERIEATEAQHLAPQAQLAIRTRGRQKPDEECPVRTCYQKDRDRILHSTAFRNLKFKTNVFLSTSGEKFRTRLTHVLEVSQLGRTICRALGLNEDLAEATALGHDLGHTPFGHVGEHVLHRLTGGKFYHSQQSLRVVDYLEKNGKGLNLTHEVRDGILKHAKGSKTMRNFDGTGAFGKPVTLEGQVIQYADWLAYVNHDVDDAVAMGVVKINDFPQDALRLLGLRHSERVGSMVRAVIEASRDLKQVRLSPAVLEATEAVRDYLYKKVYTRPEIADVLKQSEIVVAALYEHYWKNFDEILREWPWIEPEGKEKAVADFVAWQSDYACLERYEKIRGKGPVTSHG
ncbi:MAG TPA: deoxyguanosinetriphosphate triphosphohydrolase [Elusimicrobiota bacterium]|nr:deoxyguanosinetriphosphate triphosphohydrolase [Elusimicrobiota bacterium]